VFDQTRVSNQTINTTLYSLQTGDSTSFLIEIRTPTLTPYTGKYVSLLRWYPELNEYKIAEIGKTDDKGQTVFKVEIEDVDYRIGVYDTDGTLVYLANPLRMVCLASPCSYSLTIRPTDSNSFDESSEVETALTYADGVFTLVYNDPSQNTDTMALKVYQIGRTSDDLICNSNGTAFTGILSCNVSEYQGTLKAIAIRTASPERPLDSLIVDTLTTAFQGTFGLFLQFMLMVLLVFIGIISPIASVILGIASLLFGVLLFKTITYPIFIGIGVLGAIVIHFIRRSAA
jgi:hypothetical protein